MCRMAKVCKQITVFLLFAIAVSGCGSSHRSDIRPGYSDLSGVYLFSGLANYSADQFPNPLINLNDIASPSDVTIIQSESTIEANYLSASGAAVSSSVSLTNSAESGVEWQNSVLSSNSEVPIEGASILPLPAKHYRGTRILRGEDGHLYLIGTFKEKGFLFTEYWEHELKFERMD